MFSQFTLKVFTIILAIVAAILLVIMVRDSYVAPTAVTVLPAAQIPSENPPPAEPLRTEAEKIAGPEMSQPEPEPVRRDTPPAPVSVPRAPLNARPPLPDVEPSSARSPARSIIARTGATDAAAFGKAPGKFIVYSRGNELSNGFSFRETDEKFGMNSPGDIAWEFRTQPVALRGSATLKWFLDGKPRGYPMPLTEQMLQGKQIYPDMPEPGVWEIKLARPGEKDLLLFTFTILKEDKGVRP